MKFRLITEDREGDIYNPKKVPFEQAYGETVWTKKRFVGNSIITPKAIIENNEPKLIYEKTYEKPNESWFKDGRNHIQINENTWERELGNTCWFIDLNTLEELSKFARNNARNVDFDYDENIINIWSN